MVLVALGLVPAAVFRRPINDLRELATAGNAYWQPSTALRGAVSVVPFRQSNGPCHREGRPEAAQRALYAPLPAVHSRRRVAMLGRIQPPTAENHAKRRNVLEAPQTTGSRVLAFRQCHAMLAVQDAKGPCVHSRCRVKDATAE